MKFYNKQMEGNEFGEQEKNLILGIRTISECEMDTGTQLCISPLTPVDR